MKADFRYTVPHKFSGTSVLQSILDCFPFREPNSLLALLDHTSLFVNSNKATLESTLKVGDELHYSLNNYSEPTVNTQWKLLWQGEEIIAVHKPENLPVSRTTRNIYNTLVQLVRRESQWSDAHLLHRLDLETSGIVLLAKNKTLASKWQPKLNQLMQKKIYHAVVYGVPSWQTKAFECTLNTRLDSAIRCQMHVCELGEAGKHSQTNFTVLNSWNNYSLIECELMTGRKHQIRAHLASLGHAIVGDKIYAHDGAYYLKRLENKLTQEDHDMLQTEHHLLSAIQVDLKLSEQSSAVTIIDSHYSLAWQQFVNRISP